MIMILLGAPGAGKGSISAILKEQYGWTHISTGELFRKTMAQDSPLARTLKETISAGKLVNDDLTNAVVKDQLANIDLTKTNIILDGYPRNVAQLEYLNSIAKVDYAIDVYAPEEEILKRLTGRRTCPVCKTIYNIYYKKPKVDGICDNDGNELVMRQDDNEASVRQRNAIYVKNNAPLVDKVKAMGIYHRVNNQVLDEAIKQLKEICKIK